MKILNSISINMLPPGTGACTMKIQAISLEEARSLISAKAESYIGHEDLCRILKGMGLDVPFNRANFVAKDGDVALVVQYRGPRLPEGATRLPAGASLEFYIVEFNLSL
ncbi:MAG: DUF1874 domain-containing protein [Candidatus Bilamarchaeaceae archaeon]